MKRRSLAIAMAIFTLTFTALASAAAAGQTIFIVRHAETEEGGQERKLSRDGAERARVLRDMLRSIELGGIYTTDTQRTRATAAPAAEARHMDVTVYDHKDLKGLAKTLSDLKKSALVTGHTNTIPALIKELGIPNEIDVTDAEYDNLFIVTLEEGRTPLLLHLHYGY